MRETGNAPSADSSRVRADPWTKAAQAFVAVFLGFCAARILIALALCLPSMAGVLQIMDSPGAARMFASGSGSGIDVAVVEALFGDVPALRKGFLVESFGMVASSVYASAACVPLVAAVLLLAEMGSQFLAVFRARLWVVAAASAFLTLQPVATLVVLAAAFMFAKGCGVAQRSLAIAAAIVGAMALLVFAACAAYVVYANGQVSQLMGDIQRVADGDVSADTLPDSWPDAHLTPEFDREGRRTSRVEVTHDLPILWGDRGTMRLYIDEALDEGTARVTRQHDSLRLWLKKVDDVWEIDSYYSHP